MGLLFIIVGVAVIAGVALLISGRWREGLPEVAPDAARPAPAIPEEVGAVTVADIEQVRFEQSVRGYRMQDVDEVIDRLAREIEARDEEIARLRGVPSADAPAPEGPPPAAPAAGS
jgi:DivIVA domain-containing protein